MIPNIVATEHARATARKIANLHALADMSKHGDTHVMISKEDLEEAAKHKKDDDLITFTIVL